MLIPRLKAGIAQSIASVTPQAVQLLLRVPLGAGLTELFAGYVSLPTTVYVAGPMFEIGPPIPFCANVKMPGEVSRIGTVAPADALI
jgi:hypothetical protein